MPTRPVPELLSPAGSLDAVRAAVANGANAVYMGVERFNARDEGAQLTFDELRAACSLARGRGVRVYLTLNVLIKPSEMADALTLLGEAIDCGVAAAIVQDIGLIRAIQDAFPGFEIHGSTQLTVHDTHGALLMHELGLDRVVLARENTLGDIKAIRSAIPSLGLEAFVHGALCISYSGQCLMSGLISERSANRGSCAQACRKDYVLTDSATQQTLDTGYLISAKDLAAHDQLAELAEAGIGCLKIEGRKKKPEYVATVTKGYRAWLDRLATGDMAPPAFEEVQPLIQIYSRGFTAGMLVGRAGKEYITRTQPDNRGLKLGTVVANTGPSLTVELVRPIRDGDGLGFAPPAGGQGKPTGFTARHVGDAQRWGDRLRQTLSRAERIPIGWDVFLNAEAKQLEDARASYKQVASVPTTPKTPVDVRVFGSAGGPLKTIWQWGTHAVTVRSERPLSQANKQPIDLTVLRDQFGRLGETPFVLANVDATGLAQGLFLPVSELNHVRTAAMEQLMQFRQWDRATVLAERAARIEGASRVRAREHTGPTARASLTAVVFSMEHARAAADAGAATVVFDPFLRHPVPPVSRFIALAEELAAREVTCRVRTPTIVRPQERRHVDKWLALDAEVQSGHAGLATHLAKLGRHVTGDYALNVFNGRTAHEYFSQGVERLVASVELTVEELAQLVAPWNGAGFDVVVYGRPEGMIIEHCVLSAAFDRVATTCRDLCVKSHPVVELTDAAGYTFPVATDSACRNRLLHSRPIEGSEFLTKLHAIGIRGFQLIFNVPGDDVGAIVGAYARALGALETGRGSDGLPTPRDLVGPRFTRGHLVRPV